MPRVRLYKEPKEITPDPIKNLSQDQVLEMLKRYNMGHRIYDENLRFNRGISGFTKKLFRRLRGEKSTFMGSYNFGGLKELKNTLEALGQEKAMERIRQLAYEDILKGERSTSKSY